MEYEYFGEKYYGGKLPKRCPICGHKIKHPYIGHVTSEQLDEDMSSCLWMECIDESRSTIGYQPMCRNKNNKY
jgi:hypothetical protein